MMPNRKGKIADDIELGLGEGIESAARRLARLALVEDRSTRVVFNGIPLLAAPGDKPEVIVADFFAEVDRRREEWEASPEGQAKRAADERDIRERSARCDQLFRRLPGLDFRDPKHPLAWMLAYAEASGRNGVRRPPADAILAIFRDHGYEPNAFTGGDFDEGDRDIFARYVIGQALDYIESDMFINKIINHFAGLWHEKFGEGGPSPVPEESDAK